MEVVKVTNCFRLPIHFALSAFSLIAENPGMANAASTPMIAITTNSSIRVKP